MDIGFLCALHGSKVCAFHCRWLRSLVSYENVYQMHIIYIFSSYDFMFGDKLSFRSSNVHLLWYVDCALDSRRPEPKSRILKMHFTSTMNYEFWPTRFEPSANLRALYRVLVEARFYISTASNLSLYFSSKKASSRLAPSFSFRALPPRLFSFCFLALDEMNTHASATTTTCYTTTTSTTTTTTTVATDATTTTTTTQNPVKKLKFPKSTQQTRPQALYSQRIVIGSEELDGRDIDNVVRQKIDALEKSPKVVRSTALIVKRSFAPAKSRASPTTTPTPPLLTTSQIDNPELRRARPLPNGDAIRPRDQDQDAVDGPGESPPQEKDLQEREIERKRGRESV